MIKSCLLLCLLGCVFAQIEPMAMPMAMTPTPVSSEPCISNPQNESCVDFNLPNPQGYIDSLCGQMSNMPGCSIQSICQNHQNLQSSQYCSDISVLRTICTDMPKMKGCADFTSMCGNGTVVKQCQTPIFTMPTTMGIEEAMTSICDSHHMDGCDKCPSNYDCDLLMVYGGEFNVDQINSPLKTNSYNIS